MVGHGSEVRQEGGFGESHLRETERDRVWIWIGFRQGLVH